MKRKFINIFMISLVLVGVIISNAISLEAASNRYLKNNMEIVLTEDGSAHITQEMTMDIREGTENYLVMDNLRDMEIKNFRVSEDGGDFQENIYWDSSESREEKSMTYGTIETSSGYELCWGVGDYGLHTYEVSYTLTNFVQRFTDNDGFLQRVINDQMSFAPESVQVTIRANEVQFTLENTRVWAFGFVGTIYVQDGVIVAQTSEPMTSQHHMTLMAAFPHTIFNPTSYAKGSFTELKDEAFIGSTYDDLEGLGGESGDVEDKPFSPMGIFVAITATIFGLSGVFVVGAVLSNKSSKYYRERYGMGIYKYIRTNSKDETYFREIPVDKNIAAAAYLLQVSATPANDGEVVGSYLLHWVNNGWIEMSEETTIGFFNNKKKTISMHFISRPVGEIAEQTLYDMLALAAGSDGILQQKEMKKWVGKNLKEIEQWKKDFKETGENYLEQSKRMFILEDAKTKVLNDEGVTEAIHLLQLKNYLKDYSLINERQAKEIHLWKDYLIFASLLGIAEEVAKEFKDISPDFFETEMGTSSTNYFMTLHYVNMMSRTYNDSYTAATSSSGGGGSSSIGGGGGFSGGGSGGGVR